MDHYTSFSTCFSGLTIFGVPETEKDEPPFLCNTAASMSKRLGETTITFKAFVQAAGHLEKLIKMGSAVQDSLEGVVVSQLQ